MSSHEAVAIVILASFGDLDIFIIIFYRNLGMCVNFALVHRGWIISGILCEEKGTVGWSKHRGGLSAAERAAGALYVVDNCLAEFLTLNRHLFRVSVSIHLGIVLIRKTVIKTAFTQRNSRSTL